MRKSIKAVIFSALVFPGTGHLVLKKYISGILLSGITLFCLFSLFSKLFSITQDLSTKIQSGEISADVGQLTELVSQQLTEGDAQAISIPTIVIFVCWIVGIIDSYRVGLNQDKLIASSNT